MIVPRFEMCLEKTFDAGIGSASRESPLDLTRPGFCALRPPDAVSASAQPFIGKLDEPPIAELSNSFPSIELAFNDIRVFRRRPVASFNDFVLRPPGSIHLKFF
jgi:hypothetical protein